MPKLIFALFLLISMCSLLAEAQTCPGRCVNTSGNASYDSFCPTVGQGGGKISCDQYQTLGCSWKQGAPTVFQGYCQNSSRETQYDELCRNVGQANGKKGCNKYSQLGCVWTPATAICQ